MADFEMFGGFDGSDKIDPASFEKFKERVKAASAQIKAIKKEEQNKRKKESSLIQILLRFVKNHQKKDIMMLIARLLEENVPPVFILSIVVLGNKEVKKEIEAERQLKAGEGESASLQENKNLTFFEENQALPIELKGEIDEWMKNIHAQAMEDPKRLLLKVYDADENIKLPLIQLSAFILRDFLEENKQEADYEKLKEFSDFFLESIMKEAKKKLETQKELKN